MFEVSCDLQGLPGRAKEFMETFEGRRCRGFGSAPGCFSLKTPLKHLQTLHFGLNKREETLKENHDPGTHLLDLGAPGRRS